MPTYTFKDTTTGEEWDEFLSISAAETMLEENPHIKRVPVAITIIGGTGDRVKTDSGMKEMFSRIAQANPTTPLADTYGDKGIKATKTREAMKRARNKLGGSMV
jgi:hypothetical protein